MSPASLLIAVLALTLTAGGAAYAVGALPKQSVGTKQLKNKAVVASKIGKGAVTGPKVRTGAISEPKLQDGSVTSGKVRDGSLLASDFRDGELPTLPRSVELRADFTSTGAPAPMAVAGLRMTPTCALGGAGVFVTIRTTATTPGAAFDVAGVRTLGSTSTTVFSRGITTFDVVAQPAGIGQEARVNLDAVFRTPGGINVEARLFAASLSSAPGCSVWLTVTPVNG